MKTATLIMLLFLPFAADAACYCACVNGQVEAICQNNYEMRPMCGLQLCPMVPPAITPLPPLRLPPLGTSRCAPEQVWDAYLRRYVWREICR